MIKLANQSPKFDVTIESMINDDEHDALNDDDDLNNDDGSKNDHLADNVADDDAECCEIYRCPRHKVNA